MSYIGQGLPADVFGAIIVLCLFFWGLESLLSFLTGLVLG